MHLVIIHYHFNRGGVTQVVQNHLRALAQMEFGRQIDCVTVLHGGRRNGWPDELFETSPPFNFRMVEVAELEYDEKPKNESVSLTAAITHAISEDQDSSTNTLLHFHNHSLGKNGSLVGAIEKLSEQGYKILLQIHDFAEDFRPSNYAHLASSLGKEDLGKHLYPQTGSIHYAVLNGRDRTILQNAGVGAERLHSLPNPVAEFQVLPPHEDAKRIVCNAIGVDADRPLWVYPVRGIRRKNLGEMLLLSALLGNQATLAVTLAPINPIEEKSFSAWKQFSAEQGLNCVFGFDSHELSFSTIIAAADGILTTSVAEGFGMVFLEAWLAGRILAGRNLPEITADFIEEGITYGRLYDRLNIPLGLVDEQLFREELTSIYYELCLAYGVQPISPAQLGSQLDELTADGNVDFAQLSVPLQRKVVSSVVQGAAKDFLFNANPQISAAFQLDSEDTRGIIECNATSVREHYSLEAAGTRLAEVYQATIHSSPIKQTSSLPHANRILESFLDIRRLHPVRLS